jgi:glucose 1-dehydrogenase
LEVHVLDRISSGPKVDLVKSVGATYHSSTVTDLGFEPDLIIECTGVGKVIVESIMKVASGGIVCLTGVGKGGETSGLSPADLAASMVLRNNIVVGSVNANKRHWYKASEILAHSNRAMMERLITRVEKPENFRQALERKPDDIKVVLEFSDI